MQVGCLQAGQRCMGPPSSNILGFRFPDLPHAHFIAYGTGPGMVVVQQMQAANASTASIEPPPPLVLELRLPSVIAASAVPQGAANFVPGEPVSHVAWCEAGGKYLLAAAAGVHLAIFSLQRYFMRLLGDAEEPPMALTQAAPLAHAVSHAAPLAGLDFTQSGDGILVADVDGGIAMYAIPDHRSAASRLASDSAGTFKDILGAPGSLTGELRASRGTVGGLPVSKGEAAGVAGSAETSFRPPLEQAWAGRGSTVTAPQTLISAGAHCWAPAATGQPGGNNVTVWWPPEAPAKVAEEKAVTEKGPSAAQEAEPATKSSEFSSETLKIMERMGNPETSGVASVSAAAKANGSHASGGSLTADGVDVPMKAAKEARSWVMAEQLRHPMGIVGLQWSPGSLQRGHHDEVDDPTALLPASQPALLTITADGILRIWVEVTLAPSVGSNPLHLDEPALPGLPGGSHFCVTLVIQPPNGIWGTGMPRGLRASWGVPEGDAFPITGAQIRAAKVLWIAAVAEVEGENPQEKLLLWAVAGLAGVVLGGLPVGTGRGRPLRTPRAVLWGQHSGQLTWAGQGAAVADLSVTVSLDSEAPALHIFESVSSPAEGIGKIRHYRIATVEDEPLSPSAPPTPVLRSPAAARQLPLHDAAAYELLGHAAPITTLAAHPSAPLAVTLDSQGAGLLWTTNVLAPTARLPSAEGQPYSAAEWLQSGAGDDEASAVVMTATNTALQLFLLDSRRSGDEPSILCSTPLPLEGYTLTCLHALHYSGSGARVAGLLSRAPSTSDSAIVQLGCCAIGHSTAEQMLGLWSVLFGASRTEGQQQLQFLGCQAVSGEHGVRSLASVNGESFQIVLGCEHGELMLTAIDQRAEGAFELHCVASLGVITTGSYTAVAAFASGSFLAGFCESQAGMCHSRLHIWGSSHLAEYDLVADLPIAEPVTDLQWLDFLAPVPALAVGQAHRGVDVYARGHDGFWRVAARLGSISLPAPLIAKTPVASLLVASGNQLCMLDEVISFPAASGALPKETPLARVLQDISGGRPEWHPDVLSQLLQHGRLQAAVQALRALIAEAAQADQTSAVLCPRLTISDIINPSLLSWASAVAAMPRAKQQPGSPLAAPESGMSHPGTNANTGQSASLSGTPTTRQPGAQPTADPFALDMGAFGGDSGRQGNSSGSRQPGGSPADPYAFDMGAFGGESAPAAKHPGGSSDVEASNDPYAFDPAAFGQPSTSSGQDPFAFDMSAFGSEPAQPPQEQPGEEPREQPGRPTAVPDDPFAFDMSAFGEQPAAHMPLTDPYAFDMGAFGMSVPQEAQNQFLTASEQPGTVLEPVKDPYAFDMGAFGMEAGPRDDLHTDSANIAREGVSDLQPGTPPRQAVSSSREAFQGREAAQKRIVGAETPSGSRAVMPKPEKVTFRPLSESELNQLRSVLGQGPRDQGEPSGSNDDEAADAEQAYGVFGKGPQAASLAKRLLGLAEMLGIGAAGKLAEAVALDAAGQALLTMTQLAVVERGETLHLEASTSGRDAPAAATKVLRGGHAREEASRQLPWAQQRAGLLDGLGMDAVLWGLLSESHQALLSTCTDVVPASVPTGVREAAEPKIDFTSRGVKTLDLGFGANCAGPATTGPTWDTLRKIGAGFWLLDPAAVKAQADILAKARYAESKDPSDCALFYAALGKKALLQGLFSSANKSKQADFLARDFKQAKNREAACKNAFVLLGQHRHELAAAFFILGGSHRDAVGVCAHEMGDPQLALILCRLLEGSSGPLQQHLLLHDLLPEAREAGDSSAIAVCEWLLGSTSAAVATLLASSRSASAASAKTSDTQPQMALGLAEAGSNSLDILRHVSAVVPGPAAQISREVARVAHIALQCAKAHEVEGAPALALEAAAVAEALGKACIPCWKPRLAAAALLRLLEPTVESGARLSALRASSSANSAAPSHAWEAAARQELERARQKLGITIDYGEVLELMTALRGKLWLQKPIEDAVAVEPETRSETSSKAASTRRSLNLQRHPSGLSDPGRILGDSYELLRIEGDKIHDVCCCNSDAGDWGNTNADWRPFIAATGRHGLVEGELVPPKGLLADDMLSSATSESSHKGSTFTALLSDMLDAMRWPPDPWTMVAPLPGATDGAAGMPPREQPVALSNSPSHRANHIATATLAAHPFRPLYLSGSATGEIYLWQFGGKGAKAGFTPLPASSHAPPSSPASLFSSSARSWNPSPGVPFSHWGQPQSVRFSECGERFAAVGEGGVVAAWRLDAPRLASSDTGALGRADWVHQGLSKRGVDVAYVGGGTSLLAVGGFCTLGGNIVIWDTLAPLTAAPVARLAHHRSMVTSLQALPGGRVLMSADEMGMLAAVDLRMVGAGESRKALLWQARCPTGGVTCMTVGVRPSNGHAVLVSGSRSGTINVWSADRGHMLQLLVADAAGERQAGRSKGRGFFSDALKAGKPPAGGPVTGLVFCSEGLLSSSLQGSVRMHPLQ